MTTPTTKQKRAAWQRAYRAKHREEILKRQRELYALKVGRPVRQGNYRK